MSLKDALVQAGHSQLRRAEETWIATHSRDMRADVIGALGRMAVAHGAEVAIVTNQKWEVELSEIAARLESGARQLLGAGVPLCGIYAAIGLSRAQNDIE